MKIALLLIFFIVFSNFDNLAQETVNSTMTTVAINVYIDGCWDCDFDNFRREMTYVNFMRTRQEADVFILVTAQNVGGGGKKFTLYFEGQTSIYINKKDTIFLVTEVNDTDRIRSDKLLSSFKKGLIPFVLKSDLADKITFGYINDRDSINNNDNPITKVDPWNSWFFSIRGRGNLNGEKSYNGLSINGRFSANRITEANKIRFSTGYNFRKNNFNLITYDSLGNEIETETFTSLRRNQFGFGEYVKSLTDHWSTGATVNLNANTFNNLDFSGSIKIGVEYNYFSYLESDRQSLTVKYNIGPIYNDYVDTTIYLKTSELLLQHTISLDLAQKQKWGTVYFGFEYKGYLHDINLYNFSFNPNIDWNVVKGLTLGIGGYASLIGDQISIPHGSVDISDLLLKNRIIETSFSYWGYFNIRYTFGTKYNNVVNPRYNSSGGGSSFFF